MKADDIRKRWFDAVAEAHPDEPGAIGLAGLIACTADENGWFELPSNWLDHECPIWFGRKVRNALHRSGWMTVAVPAIKELNTMHAWRVAFPEITPETTTQERTNQ